MQKIVEVGGNAPAFNLPTHDGKQVSLDDFLGKQQLVLFFYPKASTGG